MGDGWERSGRGERMERRRCGEEGDAVVCNRPQRIGAHADRSPRCSRGASCKMTRRHAMSVARSTRCLFENAHHTSARQVDQAKKVRFRSHRDRVHCGPLVSLSPRLPFAPASRARSRRSLCGHSGRLLCRVAARAMCRLCRAAWPRWSSSSCRTLAVVVADAAAGHCD